MLFRELMANFIGNTKEFPHVMDTTVSTMSGIFLHKENLFAIYMNVWLVIATRKDVKPNVRHTLF